VRTRAVPGADGSWKITGNKIFISAGEHDLTENIVHLVLARLPDAPAGTRGISLFVVPKFLPNPDGTPGPRNGVSCSRLEHKMGIRAAATCAIDFDEATGWLVGRPHKGMSAMFTMMNSARLGVGLQGLGVAEIAYQGALAYARERLQGRSPSGAKAPEKPADPLIVHPDIRRMLLTMKAQIEGSRALAYWIGLEIDIAGRHPDPARRQAADDLVALMTPIIKSGFTDLGFAAANLGVQVWGGHGYIRDNGMEQLVRDARICQLYEGANGIQALDLVGRKLGTGTGRLLRRFFHPVAAFIAEQQGDAAMAEFTLPLHRSLARLQQATAWVAETGLKRPEAAAAAASEYLELFGLVALAYMWARMAKLALARRQGEDGAFYQAKLATARFFMAKLLPRHASLATSLTAGAEPVMALPDAGF
jgi:alkylation response protein AidB-like acyl-CoA dehydrogenase